MKSVSTSAFQRTLARDLRKQATYLLIRGIEIVPPPLFNEAVAAIRKAGKPLTVDAVVDHQMRRAMRAIGRVNEPKGKPGHDTLTEAELNAAISRDDALGYPFLQAYGQPHGPRTSGGASFATAVASIMKDVTIISESDSSVDYVASPAKVTTATNAATIMKAFASDIASAFDQQDGYLRGYTADVSSRSETQKLLADFANPGRNPDAEARAQARGFRALAKAFVDHNIRDVRYVKIGPKDDDGSLGIDRGAYLKLIVGTASDGKLVGVSWEVVET